MLGAARSENISLTSCTWEFRTRSLTQAILSLSAVDSPAKCQICRQLPLYPERQKRGQVAAGEEAGEAQLRLDSAKYTYIDSSVLKLLLLCFLWILHFSFSSTDLISISTNRKFQLGDYFHCRLQRDQERVRTKKLTTRKWKLWIAFIKCLFLP